MALKRNVGLLEGLKYRGGGPMLAWLLHRISGLGILVFVGLHILAAFLTQQFGSDAGIFINIIYESWAFQIFIFFCVLFHAINGLRIIILDLWPALLEYQREAIWLEWFVFIPIFGLAVFVIFSGSLGG
ncbi:MAG: hypothetical protein GXP40_10940 [Chloroflexi bacterium]|nr:hypothetical protein [Chloroflexota bacterium]